MQKIKTIIGIVLMLLLISPAVYADEDTGSISGTIDIFRTRLSTDGPKPDGDVVVFVEMVGGSELSPPEEPVPLDQSGLVFIPHVLAIQAGTTVKYLNNDNDDHNVYILVDETGETTDYGTWPPGETRETTYDDPGLLLVLCKLHLEMGAFILILDTPYFTMAEIDGESQTATYSLEGLPPGDYILNIWNKELLLKTGSIEVSIAAGETTELDLTITKEAYVD